MRKHGADHQCDIAVEDALIDFHRNFLCQNPFGDFAGFVLSQCADGGERVRIVPRMIVQADITAGIIVGNSQHTANVGLRHRRMRAERDEHVDGFGHGDEAFSQCGKQHGQRSGPGAVGNDQQNALVLVFGDREDTVQSLKDGV